MNFTPSTLLLLFFSQAHALTVINIGARKFHSTSLFPLSIESSLFSTSNPGATEEPTATDANGIPSQISESQITFLTDETESKPSASKLEGTGEPTDISFNSPAPVALAGVTVTSVLTGEEVDLSEFLTSKNAGKVMLVLGTYAADFNAIEYAQRLRHYLPKLQKRGITKFGLILNCEADAAKTLVETVDLLTDATAAEGEEWAVELFVDPKGIAGRSFGVSRGWRPDDEEMSPYLKLFGMLWGLGAWATLPAVIGGYIGNPFIEQPWIEDALAVGGKKGRWPSNALDLDDETGEIKVNKFSELPYVGEWKRRPLELATLRLQNMVDISIKNWKDLAPTDDALKIGVLTQLGGCVVVDSESGENLYKWRDPGICAVANFEDILKKIQFAASTKG